RKSYREIAKAVDASLSTVSNRDRKLDGGVARDDAFLLQFPDPVRYRAQAGVDRLCDFPVRLPGVCVQEPKDSSIEVIKEGRSHRFITPRNPDVRTVASPARDKENNVSSTINISFICTIWSPQRLYMSKILPETSDGLPQSVQAGRIWQSLRAHRRKRRR